MSITGGLTSGLGLGLTRGTASDIYPATSCTFDATLNTAFSEGAQGYATASALFWAASFWFKTTNTTTSGQVIYVNETESLSQFELQFGVDNLGRVFFSGANPADDFYITSATGFNDGKWHHTAFNYNAATGAYNLVVDNNVTSGTTSLVLSLSEINQIDLGLGFNGELSEIWYDHRNINMATDYTKFISGGRPKDLGADGSLPTGNQPAVYMRFANNTNFGLNSGGAGDVTPRGTGSNTFGSTPILGA